MIKWAEIADFSETIRMKTLSLALTRAGLENEVTFLGANRTNVADVVKQAQKEFSQIRIGGDLCADVLDLFENVPIAPKQIGAADSLLLIPGPKGRQWWPRNFLTEGFHRAIVNDVKSLNTSSAVFVLGTGWEARSAIAALTKIGFRRFTISDKHDQIDESFIASLQRTHFDVDFQFVARAMITQLPSVHSVALNTLVKGRDDGALDELIYFNYLELGGVWLDLPLIPSNDALAEEADAAGAFVEPGIKVAVATDALWAEACFSGSNFKFDRPAYRSLLSKALRA